MAASEAFLEVLEFVACFSGTQKISWKLCSHRSSVRPHHGESGLLEGASCHFRICFHTAHLLTLYSGLCVRVCACGRFHVALIYLQTSDKFYVFFFLLELPKI